MVGDEVLDQQWESQAELDAVLAETGVTHEQVNRWRRAGLLPREIEQLTQAYRGSFVRYPKGTCAQIRAANALFKQKNRADYVGRWLWRYGFEVDEKYWRARLKENGRTLDRILKLMPWLVDRFDRVLESRTFYEAAAQRLETTEASCFPESKVG